jgi:hypothetical protein
MLPLIIAQMVPRQQIKLILKTKACVCSCDAGAGLIPQSAAGILPADQTSPDIAARCLHPPFQWFHPN